MSTPVSVEPPPMAHIRSDSDQRRDLQTKLQRMIAMQHQEQQHSSSELDENANVDSTDPRDTIENTTGIGGMSKRTATEVFDLSTMGGATVGVTVASQNAASLEPANKGVSFNKQDAGLPPPSPTQHHGHQQGVGQGTLHFPSTYNPVRQRNNSSTDQLEGMVLNSMMGSQQQQQQQQQQSQGQGQGQGQEQNQQQQQHPPHQIYTGYGAVDSVYQPPPTDYHQHQQQHEFLYGNSDLDADSDELWRSPSRYRPENTFCGKICCIYAPLVNLLLQDNVHRSFCYGAIDGLLTGSGIVSAFCALEVLRVQAAWEVRVAVVAFSTAACVADAVCMAIGHIWTSFVVSSAHAQERLQQRRLLDDQRADAKAKLVDMLLLRGVLKIDAMSLADTLEGYPDLFVSALVGDSLLAGTDMLEGDDETDEGGGGVAAQLITGRRGSNGSFGNDSRPWKFPSYSQFNEMDDEPEMGNVNLVLKESQTEGFFMMLGFATFAVLPSLLWLWLPLLVLGSEPESSAHIEDGSGSSFSEPGQTISLPSLVVSLSGMIMWCLGVWKSRYLDSHWVMSGIENVVVLLACVLSAYGVGFGLSYAIGGIEGVTLSNIVPK